mgnify:CR=1 FL=1
MSYLIYFQKKGSAEFQTNMIYIINCLKLSRTFYMYLNTVTDVVVVFDMFIYVT